MIDIDEPDVETRYHLLTDCGRCCHRFHKVFYSDIFILNPKRKLRNHNLNMNFNNLLKVGFDFETENEVVKIPFDIQSQNTTKSVLIAFELNLKDEMITE